MESKTMYGQLFRPPNDVSEIFAPFTKRLKYFPTLPLTKKLKVPKIPTKHEPIVF